jgi:hypothetical protein
MHERPAVNADLVDRAVCLVPIAGRFGSVEDFIIARSVR